MNNLRTRTAGKCAFHKSLPLVLAAVALMLTGCPHYDYIVQLKPQGSSIERTLTFYCADGVNTNTGVPNYRSFGAAELSAITALYPAGGVTNDGGRYIARGEFTNQLPADVGGTGTYRYYATSLGEAGFYAERFRGNDDFAGMTERHFQSADRVTDLMMGWSQMELGREAGYSQLRRFLDVDFRRDLKNLSAYWWAGTLAGVVKTNASEEYVVRFGQYLWEHGYFKTEEIPGLFRAVVENDSQMLPARIQRLVATKMGVPETNPVPASLAFLADEKTMESSCDRYLSGTELYRARLKQWKKAKKLKPDTKRPEPDDVLQDALADLAEFDVFGHPDQLAVRLSLAAPPLHSNGQWDETRKQVLWETDIVERTNATHVPFVCYASWAQPEEEFQKAHFGRTALTGDPLAQYCLWRNGVDAQHGAEWDTFISGLQPGGELMAKLDAFRFSGEPDVTATNGQQEITGPSVYPLGLLKTALE
jgi:hypothetical protein